jgi:tripartite-type tricarboxylate transporter receptor subunit TctC
MNSEQAHSVKGLSVFIRFYLWLEMLVLCACATQSHAQALDAPKPGTYPDQPIRFMIPFAPGGTTDLVARMVGQEMSRSLGQPLVIDNRGGGGGTIATDIVAKAAGDGYTLMMNHQGMTFNATLYTKLPYDTVNDFAAIAMVGTTPNVLAVNPSLAPKSVKELVALARSKPHGINYGSGGVGSSAHLAVEIRRRAEE